MGLGKGLYEMLKRILDTNYVLRYLLRDVPDMFEVAYNEIMHGNCLVHPEVIAEAVYVLKSVYKVERIEISNAMICFLDEVICEKREVVIKGLLLFGETTLDFVDCLLIAYNQCYGYEILTFDKKVIKKLI